VKSFASAPRAKQPVSQSNFGAARAFAAKAAAWLELLKPITWMPVMCAYVSGALCSPHFSLSDFASPRLWLGLLMSGPLISGTCQAMNDYFDRDLDAINEPYRPIPSGRIGLQEATIGIAALCLATVVVAYFLHPWIAILAVIGVVNAHLYSARPIKLKRILWVGNGVVALSYILLPWLSGEITFSGRVGVGSVMLATCYVVASVGSMTTNDFKSVTGDAWMGIQTLPQAYGIRRGAWLGVATLDIGQFLAAAYLAAQGLWMWSGLVVATIIPQIILQRSFLQDPVHRDVWYNARAQGFLVLGMFLSAWALRP
jgi:chlorophyll/bacteriochlorophyll a synthase